MLLTAGPHYQKMFFVRTVVQKYTNKQWTFTFLHCITCAKAVHKIWTFLYECRWNKLCIKIFWDTQVPTKITDQHNFLKIGIS